MCVSKKLKDRNSETFHKLSFVIRNKQTKTRNCFEQNSENNFKNL